MTLRSSLSQAPTRLAAGAFILNSGLSKRELDEERVKHVYGMARDAYPFLEPVDPAQFVKVLSMAEIGLGAALLAPVVPRWLAGAGLSAFAGGLLGLYFRLPGMHEENGVRPTPEGIPLAKDVWLASIGAALTLSGLMDRRARHSRRRKKAKAAHSGHAKAEQD